MGFFTSSKKRNSSVEKAPEQKSRSGRFALRGSARSLSPRPPTPIPTENSMGTVASVKAAAQAKSSSKSTRRFSLNTSNGGAARRPTRFVASSRKLGSGAYGAVLLGTDLCTGEQVAMKLIPEGRMKPASLEREVAMLRRLSEACHPALLHFHAHVRPAEVKAGEVKAKDDAKLPITKPLEECHALVMEACRGGELFEYVVKADGLSERESGPLFAQLVDAVRAAHFLGIAHRDLKLENVLLCGVTGEPEAKLIKLIDWGLAHQHAFGPDGAVLPEMLHSRCGSRSYMAPEVTNRQISSVRGYNGFLADAWSLGVCLFAMHLGFFPFEQADPEVDWRARRAVEAQRRGESTMQTIFSFYPNKPLELSRSLLDLLDRLLIFDPSRRATLSEVADHAWLVRHMPALSAQTSSDLPAALARMRDLSELDARSRTSTSKSPSQSASTDGIAGGAVSLDPRGDLCCSTTSASDVAHAHGAAEGRARGLSQLPPSSVERQDSASTAHSVGSSVGSSVVQSVARLRALEAARDGGTRPCRSTHDASLRDSPEDAQGTERHDAHGSGAVSFTVAGGHHRHRSEEQYPSAHEDLHHLSQILARQRISQQ